MVRYQNHCKLGSIRPKTRISETINYFSDVFRSKVCIFNIFWHTKRILSLNIGNYRAIHVLIFCIFKTIGFLCKNNAKSFFKNNSAKNGWILNFFSDIFWYELILFAIKIWADLKHVKISCIWVRVHSLKSAIVTCKFLVTNTYKLYHDRTGTLMAQYTFGHQELLPYNFKPRFNITNVS